MRRTLFYLSVALLAFGLGLLVVFKFYWINAIEVKTKEIPDKIKPIEENFTNKLSSATFTCEDKAINTVWKKLKKDKHFIDDAYSVIEARQIKSCQELFNTEAVDLNNDKVDEIIVQGNYILFCGSGGDCQTWVVSKTDNEYKIIFEARAGEFPEDIKFLHEKTNNFQNLKVKTNNGWEANKFGLFKFAGKKYQLTKCTKDVNSAYDYEGNNEEKLVSVKLNECL